MRRLLRQILAHLPSWTAPPESPETPRRVSLVTIERVHESPFDCLGGRYRLVLLRVTVHAGGERQVWYRCRAERRSDGLRIVTRTHRCAQIAETLCRNDTRRWQPGKRPRRRPDPTTSITNHPAIHA